MKSKYLKITIAVYLIATTLAVFAQSSIGIAPGEFARTSFENSVSILPITAVEMEIHGPDSLLVSAEVDSFKTTGGLLVKTFFTLRVAPLAPVGELHITARFIYKADDALQQISEEDFVIDTAVEPSILAAFSADTLQGDAPLTINFSNESFGNIVGYNWNFGDGSSSGEFNPQHTYTAPGSYTVSLTVFNFSIQNVQIKENYIHVNSPTEIGSEGISIKDFQLRQNFPNPFNPTTLIRYDVPAFSAVDLSIYNALGQKVFTLVNLNQAAGSYNIKWNAAEYPTGVYYYVLQVDGKSITRKMLLIR